MTTATLLRSPLTGARGPSPALAGLAAVVAPARSARVALAGAVASVPPIAALHLDAPSGTSMARTTISDVVVTTPAGEPLFALTAGALAVAGIALVRALAGLSGTAWTRALLAGWALALVAAAVFPTNLPGRPGDTSSTIDPAGRPSHPGAGRAGRGRHRPRRPLPRRPVLVLANVVQPDRGADHIAAVDQMPVVLIPRVQQILGGQARVIPVDSQDVAHGPRPRPCLSPAPDAGPAIESG